LISYHNSRHHHKDILKFIDDIFQAFHYAQMLRTDFLAFFALNTARRFATRFLKARKIVNMGRVAIDNTRSSTAIFNRPAAQHSIFPLYC
jgi:hypothetical protein